VDSRTSDVSIFMCSGGVCWILVMFDVMTRLLCLILICWIVMCMLHFLLLCMCCIFIMPGFGGSQAGEADKVGKKNLKKFLCLAVMFINSPMYIIFVPWLAGEHKFGYVPRLAEERKFVYVPQLWSEERKVEYAPRFWAEEHKVGYVPRFWPRNIRSHMFLGFGPRNVSLDMFLDWPRNISSYVPRPRFPCSLMFIKIYSSVMFLGWLGNISYVPQPLSHTGFEKIKLKPLYVCPGCSNHT
jgi:hypothetical protein